MRLFPHWIFDLDGTLTVAVHDFAAFKASIGLTPDQPILETLALLPPDQAARASAALEAWERDLAGQARPAPGAELLLRGLLAAGCRLGILTRNSQEVALLTLEAAGLGEFFSREFVVGRAEAEPKPSPAGVRLLLDRWGAAPEDAVMVGDWDFDVIAGRAAGASTVLVDARRRFGSPPEAADRVVPDLDALRQLISPARKA